MSLARRHSASVTPLQTVATTPGAKVGRSRVLRAAPHWKKVAFAAAVLIVLGGSFGAGGLVQQQKAKATLPVTDLFCVTCWLNRLLDEVDEITVDQIRKIVIEQITQKVIEKIIYGDNGGIGIGGASGTSSSGAAAFVNDYGEFLYAAAGDDAREYIDATYDRYFPSYIDPEVKQLAKDRFDPDHNFVPEDCVDFSTINFENNPAALGEYYRASQPGCNELSAFAILAGLSSEKAQQIAEASKAEAEANNGLVSKDEDTNKLKQSGVVYEGIVQGAINSVYEVQTNSNSAVSQIIGALVDDLINRIMSESAT